MQFLDISVVWSGRKLSHLEGFNTDKNTGLPVRIPENTDPPKFPQNTDEIQSFMQNTDTNNLL